MDFEFADELWYWRGPAPFHFVTVADEASDRIKDVASSITYGWGMIPVTVRVGASEWTTSLWPKNGGYILPIKKWVQEAEGLDVGDVVEVGLSLRS